MSSFSPERQKQIIIDCMALHNFIRDSELRDEEFDKCDDDDDYMSDNEDANVGQEVAKSYEDGFSELKNEIFMNTICDNIANVLVSGGCFVHGRSTR
jgi:hypothetical protein